MKKAIAGLLLFGSFMSSLVLVPISDALAGTTESATNTVVYANQSGSIVDSSGATWTIASGVVKKNGASAGYSARVISLAYVNHVVWQENADHRWWSWKGTKWSGGSGTSTRPFTTSANNSAVLAGSPVALIDANRDAWTIASGVVKKNGASAGYSANVVRIAIVSGVVWQENASHLWWSWTGSAWKGDAGITTSPLPSTTSSSTTSTTTTTSATSTSSLSATNPFSGKTLFTNTGSNALTQAAAWRTTRPTDAAAMDYLAAQPTAVWFGDWNSDIESDARKYVDGAAAKNQLPVLVAYSIPNRDCGSGYSSGGVSSATSYHDWMVKFANGIGTRQAVVILEPDAVALDCFDDARGAMLKDAVSVLEAKPNVAVYIDAGHPNWTSAATMATRLTKSGIAQAQGFALNVSNFYSTSQNVTFGNSLAALVGGKHYVIDTSRNQNGWQGEWCNPLGAGIGAKPTVSTGEALYDAGLWVKAPGDSDGSCNGGPSAGAWWSSYALNLYNQGTH